MAADFVASFDHGTDHVRVTLRSHGDGEDSQRYAGLFEQLEQAPDTGAAAVFVERFHAHVTCALQGLGGDHFREKGF
ncbi:hypothetical protein D3C81_2209040 [compost metagenome]